MPRTQKKKEKKTRRASAARPASARPAPQAGKARPIDRLFAEEVENRQEDVRQQAVQAILSRRDLLGRFTVGQYVQKLQREAKDMWEVVAEMNLLGFADIVSGAEGLRAENERLKAEIDAVHAGHYLQNGAVPPKRSRLRNVQKDALKRIILDVLKGHDEGLRRGELAACIPDQRLKEVRLVRFRLTTKLRIPLQELLQEGKMITTGEKRFLRYMLPEAPTSEAGKPA